MKGKMRIEMRTANIEHRTSNNERKTRIPFDVRCSLSLLLSVLCVSGITRAADHWTLTDAALAPAAVHDVKLDGSSISASTTDGGDRQTPLDQFVSLARVGATTTLPQ